MTDPLERAIEIFGEICDLAPEEQALRLSRIAEEDPVVRAEVEEILLGDREPDERLDRQAEDFVTWQTVLLEARDTPVPEEVIESLTDRGRSLAHYRQEQEIGRGGMGAVYQVWDTDLERRLAMKILGSGEAPHSSVGRRRLQRFLDEARVTSQLDHPGIVPVHDLGIDSAGRAFFTMKFVKGRTLKEVFQLVRRGEEGWTWTRALHVLLRVCEAMSYAHAKGVVHRDLKPANIMVGRFGEVYVVDWGVARLRSSRDGRDLRPRPALPAAATGEIELGSPVVTMDGTVVGTPHYMSPEQARGGWVDERSDVYAIGAMLYTLVAGRPPYGDGESEDSTPYEVLERVIEGPPPPSRELSTAAPELEAICTKAMARAAEERYRDVSELAEDLRAWLEGRVVSAHRTGAVIELRKWMGRNRALASSIAAGIAILVAGLVASLVLADLAENRRQTAQESAAEARRERARALRLGSLMTLDYELTEGLDELWPAHPENAEAYAAWLDQAGEIATLYPEVALELAALRARARPRTDAEHDRERRTHPDFPVYSDLERELGAARRAQAVRSGGEPPPDFALDERVLPTARRDLNELAWRLAGPDRVTFGREAEGLALARRAVGADGPVPSAYRDTLAWALFANGLDDQARAEIAAAVESADPDDAEEFRQSRARLEQAIEVAHSGATLTALEAQRADLDAAISERRSFAFGDPEDQHWHDVLARFVVTFESLFEPETGLAGRTSADWGWEIERRLAWAERVRELTVTGAEPARRWAQAIASIADATASPAYRGLVIEPQLGLLPLGRDPRSGLWEFVHLQTGAEPVRTEDGTLAIDADTGLVLVLLPGGTFTMGAQGASPDQPNYDPAARPSEGPVHEVTLTPFFLSKYEMTQAQWLRLAGRNPSFYSPEYQDGRMGTTLVHPMERVSWDDCAKVCRWIGLALPSEAQWEYAARGGTDSVWWAGDERDALVGSVNLADRSARRVGAPWPQIDDWPELDDGHPVHAPVSDTGRDPVSDMGSDTGGGRAPNPFGLHDVHGNVWEWCRDAYDPEFYADSGRADPVHDPGGSGGPGNRVSRGGSFRSRSYQARSAYRQNHAPETAVSELGLRPARALDPR